MKIIEKVVQSIKPLICGKNILEVACGSADLSVAMSPVAATVNCIDLVDFRLNSAIVNCTNVKFFVMNATKMDFENDSFDTVVIYNAAYHIKDEFEQILYECLRVAKGGGAICLISTFSIDKALIKNTFSTILQKAGVHFTVQDNGTLVSAYISVPSK